MSVVLFPYLLGSRSAKSLAAALGTKQVRPGGRYRPRPNHVVINWGNSRPPTTWSPATWLNTPQSVALTANKLAAFGRMREAGVPIPTFTDDASVAKSWGKVIVIRHQLSGHSGAGIEFGEAGQLPPPAPLYTLYAGKRTEYRIHVFRGAVIDRQIKLRRHGIAPADVNWRVRNHASGWIYGRRVDMPDDLDRPAIAAVQSLGLDFGAVDILRTNHGQTQVLEVNTAPGLEGATLHSYHSAFDAFVRQAGNIPPGAGIGEPAVRRRVPRRQLGGLRGRRLRPGG